MPTIQFHFSRISRALFWTLLALDFASGCNQAKQTLLIPELETRLGQSIGGKASIGDARYDGRIKRIVLQDVVLKADDGSLRGRFAQVTASSTDAYNVDWAVTEVALSDGSLKLHPGLAGHQRPDQAPNFPKAVTLKNIELVAERGPVLLRSEVRRATVRSRGGGFEFDAKLRAVAFTRRSTRLRAESIELKGAAQGDEVTLESASLLERGRRLTLSSVRFDLSAPHRLDATVRGAVSLDEMIGPVRTGVDNKRSRGAGTEIEFKTPLLLRGGRPTGACSVELRGQLDAIDYSGGATCTPTQSGFSFHGSLSGVEGGRLAVEAEFAFNSVDVPIEVRKLHVAGREVAPGALPGAAALATSKSLLGGTLEATGQLWPTRLHGDLVVHLSEPSLGKVDRWLTTRRLSVTTGLNLDEGKLSRSNTRVSLGPGSRIAGRVLSRLSATIPGGSMDGPADLAGLAELSDLTIEGRGLSARVEHLDLDKEAGQASEVRVEVKRMPLAWLLKPVGLAGNPVLQVSGAGAGTVFVTPGDAGFDSRGKMHFKRPLIGDVLFDDGEVSWRSHSELRANVGSVASAAVGSAASFDAGSPELHAVFARGEGRVEVQLPDPKDSKAGARIRVDGLRLGRHRIQGLGHLGERADVQFTVQTASPSRPTSARLRLLGPKADQRLQRCPAVPSTADQGHVLCGSIDDGTLEGYVLFDGRPRRHRGHGTLRGRLEAHGADIWRLLPGAASVPAGSAKTTATLSFEGAKLWSPSTWSGEIQVQALDLQYAHISAGLTKPARLSLVDGQVSVEGVKLSSGAATLAMFGTLGLDGGGELTVLGSLQAYALAPLLPMVESGRGKFAVRAVLAEGLSLGLTSTAVSVELSSGHRLRELGGVASWSNRGWLFNGVNAKVEQGKVTAEGTFGTEGNLDLDVTAQDVQLEPDARVALHFSGNVHLSKTARTLPKASGELSVSKFSYGKHIQFPEVILAKSASRGENGKGGKGSAQPRLQLNLKVRQAGPWKLRNGLLDVALQSAEGLTITGTDVAPGLLGAVNLAGGRLIFHSDELRFKSGSVRFTSRTRIAPRFQLSADAPARRRPGARVRLQAQGDDSAFALGLRCDAGKGAPVPPPFVCRYEGRDFKCPDITRLASVWRCAHP